VPEYPVPELGDVPLEAVLKALGDPIRLEIVRRLADGRPQPKLDLWTAFEISRATCSHHFKTLREAGLTAYIVHGRTHEIVLRRAELDAHFPGLIGAVTGVAAGSGVAAEAGTAESGPR